MTDAEPPWRDSRFPASVEAVRKACGVPAHDHEDDVMIGMMLDRFGWDHAKVEDAYAYSRRRREDLGLAQIKRRILVDGLALQQFPHHNEVGNVIPIFASTSLDRRPSGGEPSSSAAGAEREAHVIGSYELRYGQGDNTTSELVTPAEFTTYMLFVTQWRWIQCERYTRRHGELGHWSMIHDMSCPDGFFSLWGRARSIIGQYMTPVEEACAGLFPPMVQKILIINVPRLFAPVWSVISYMLPEHHKERIVLLTTAKTSTEELKKYMPEEHIPPHVKNGG